MITLALDLAGRTGYAIRWDTGEVKTGICTLVRGDGCGKRSAIPMVRLWRRLNRFSDRFPIRKVIFEETFAMGAAKYRLESLQHATILWCCERGYKWQRVSPPAWKKATLGNGSISKQKYWQAAVDYFPQHNVHTDDIAAALWLLEYERNWR